MDIPCLHIAIQGEKIQPQFIGHLEVGGNRFLNPVTNHLSILKNTGQRIINFVGHPCGQTAKGDHFFRLDNHFFQPDFFVLLLFKTQGFYQGHTQHLSGIFIFDGKTFFLSGKDNHAQNIRSQDQRYSHKGIYGEMLLG